MAVALPPSIGASNIPQSHPAEPVANTAAAPATDTAAAPFTVATAAAETSAPPADEATQPEPLAEPPEPSAPAPPPLAPLTEGPDALLREAVSRLGAVYEGAQRWARQREGGNTLDEALALVSIDDGVAVAALLNLTNKYAAAWPQRWVVPLVTGRFAMPDPDVHWGPGTSRVPTVPSVFWSNSCAFDAVARYLAGGYTFCEARAYLHTLGLVFEATARFRAYLRGRDCFVGWVDLDHGRSDSTFSPSTNTLIRKASVAIHDDKYARWLLEIRANATACVGQHHCEDTRNIMIWAHDDLFCRKTIVRWFQTATLSPDAKAEIVAERPWLEDVDAPIVSVCWDPVEGPPSPSLFYSEEIEGSELSTTPTSISKGKLARPVSRISLHRSTPLPPDNLRGIPEDEGADSAKAVVPSEGGSSPARLAYTDDSDAEARARIRAVAHVPGHYPPPPSETASERNLAMAASVAAVGGVLIGVPPRGASRPALRRLPAYAAPPAHSAEVPTDVSEKGGATEAALYAAGVTGSSVVGVAQTATHGRRASVVLVALPLAPPAPLRSPPQPWPLSAAANGHSSGPRSASVPATPATPATPSSAKSKPKLAGRISAFFSLTRRRRSPSSASAGDRDVSTPLSAVTFGTATTSASTGTVLGHNGEVKEDKAAKRASVWTFGAGPNSPPQKLTVTHVVSPPGTPSILSAAARDKPLPKLPKGRSFVVHRRRTQSTRGSPSPAQQ